MGAGRPKTYIPEKVITIKETIIEGISNGKSLKSILDNDKTLPSRPIIYEWLNSENKDFDKEFLNNYTRATQDRADYLVEETITIADDQEDDVYIDDEGVARTNHNVIQRARLRVDTRKWIAGKMKPKKYGDSQLLKLGDNEGNELKVNAIFSADLLNIPSDKDGDEKSGS